MTSPFQFYREATALRHIKRFQQHACVRPISVAEHQFYAALLAYQFADELTQRGVEIDRNAACVAAMHHDLAEALTTDLPHQVKRFSPQLEAEWGVLEGAVEQELDGIMTVPRGYAGGIVGLVGKTADWAELILYVCEERLVGSHALDAAAETIFTALHDLEDRHLLRYTRYLMRGPAEAVRRWFRQTVVDLREVYDGGWEAAAHRPLTFGQWGRKSSDAE